MVHPSQYVNQPLVITAPKFIPVAFSHLLQVCRRSGPLTCSTLSLPAVLLPCFAGSIVKAYSHSQSRLTMANLLVISFVLVAYSAGEHKTYIFSRCTTIVNSETRSRHIADINRK